MDVRGTQRLDALARRGIERSGDTGRGIGADVFVIAVAGSRPDEQRDGIGAADDHCITLGGAASPVRDHTDARLESERAGHGTTVGGRARAISIDAAHHEVAVGRRLDGRALRRLHPSLEGYPPGTAGGQPHDDDLVGGAGEHLTGERDAVAGEGHVGRCRRSGRGRAGSSRRHRPVETSARGPRPSDTAFARAASPSRSLPTSFAAAGYSRAASRRLTSGSASFACGFTGSYGRPAHSVSSFSCSRSCTMPPNTIAPMPAIADRKGANPLDGAGLSALPGRVRRQQRMIGGWRPIPEAQRRSGRQRLADQPRRRRRLRWRDNSACGKRCKQTRARDIPTHPRCRAHLAFLRASSTTESPH